MSLTAAVAARFARQLQHPQGLAGRAVGAALNRHNGAAVTTAVDALSLRPGSVVADLGFGGGVGLQVLLRHVGTVGQVHGVELSQTMLQQAARRFAHERATGRLQLHPASMTDLPHPDGAFDGVLTVNTIYYLADLHRALSELARVLATTGRAIIGLADPDAMADRSFSQHGLRLRPLPTVIALAEQAGLRLEKHLQLPRGSETMHLLLVQPQPHRQNPTTGT